MEADYFVLRLLSITQDINAEHAELILAIERGRATFEQNRRAGLDVSTALEHAEAEMLIPFTVRLDAAAQLRGLLLENFDNHPRLATAPCFKILLHELMPLLTAEPFRQGNRLANALIIGKVADFNESNLTCNGL